MKTIPEIIDIAISSTDTLPTAMLHCKVLADQLDHAPFREWVTREINGYEYRSETPEYRQIRGRLKGTFERYLVSTTREDVPVQLLESQLHTLVETVALGQPIAALSEFADDGTLAFPVGMEQYLLGLINSQYGIHGRFLALYVQCPKGSFRPVLATIQHKLVSLLSEINQLFPEQEDIGSISPAQAAELDRRFDKLIHINQANNVIISPSGVHVDQSSSVFQQINVHNWPDLDDFLDKQNISEEKRQGAKEILDKVQQGDQSEEIQEELKEWVGEAAEDMASGVGDVLKEATKKAATDTLVDGLKRFAPEIARWGWVLALSFV